VASSSLRFVSKLEVLETGSPNPDWVPVAIVPIVTDYEEIHLKPSNSGYSDMRIMLCLQSNDSWCGYEHLVKMDASSSTFLRESKGFTVDGFASTFFVIVAVVLSAGLALLCCCCIKKHFNPENKLSKNPGRDLEHQDEIIDHVSKVSQSLQGNQFYITDPSENKVMMNGMSHDPNKLSAFPIYATTGPRNGSNGHISQGYYITGEHDPLNDPSPAGSNDTAQSDLWMMKTEDGQEIPVSYHALYGQTSSGGMLHEVAQSFPSYTYTSHTASPYTTHDDPSSYPMSHEEQAINLKNSICEYFSLSFSLSLLFFFSF